MAHLLGNRYCIESLRNDVTDLQGAVVDIFSRIGPVRCSSWKYPDKVACDLDITEILELYDYTEDVEERQVAHIVLLEMVIDRLVLLLQSTSKYTDQLLAPSKGSSPQNVANTSIGLVVKKYWNKMVQLGSLLHQTNADVKSKTRQVKDLEISMKEMSMCGVGEFQPSIPLNEADMLRMQSAASGANISRDECIKATQTLETAFVPCESCHEVQHHLRLVGESTVKICLTQDLPSSLSRHMAQMEDIDWMSGNDIAKWSMEQNKDLVRINKYLSDLHATIEPLKGNLDKQQTTSRQLKAKLTDATKSIQLEKDTISVQQKQYEGKIRVLEKKSHDEMTKIQQEKTVLQQSHEEQSKQLETMKSELRKQDNLISKLENNREDLARDIQEKLETEIDRSRKKLADVNDQLQRANKHLEKEKSKSSSLIKRSSFVQEKQDDLIIRMDEMDQENEELRGNVGQLEEQKEQLEEQIEALKEGRRELKRELTDQKKVLRIENSEKEKLLEKNEEQQHELDRLHNGIVDTKEREKLLVEYPDLNGPVNKDFEGTGDIVVDMENQVKANKVRISILEEQNTKLRRTITKLLASGNHTAQNIPGDRIPLWSPEESTTEQHHHNYGGDLTSSPESDHTPPRTSSHQSHQALKARPMSATQKRSSRPPSGKLIKGMTPHTDSTINTYKQLKKAGLIKVQPEPPPPRAFCAPEPDYPTPEMFTCFKCNKMYSNSRDLDLHSSYCYGGI